MKMLFSLLNFLLNPLKMIERSMAGAVQFGIATMTFGGTAIGYLQNCSIDFSFDVAQLYAGNAIYPVDVRTHTGAITGTSDFADLTSNAFSKILGGTKTGDTITLADTDFPSTWQLVASVITDSITFQVTFHKARSTSMSIPFARDSHLIPSFGFQIEANDAGQVATIDVGDVS